MTKTETTILRHVVAHGSMCIDTMNMGAGESRKCADWNAAARLIDAGILKAHADAGRYVFVSLNAK